MSTYDEEPIPPSGGSRKCGRQVPNHLNGVHCGTGLEDILEILNDFGQRMLARHHADLNDKDGRAHVCSSLSIR
jgi:hypothetical protein